MTTLFLSLGKAAGVRPSDILGMFYREGKLPDNSVGHIALFERHSLIDVDKDHADKLCENLSNSKLRNQRFRIGPDRMA
jgi:ATP-dependent RNA helicase DeaD